MEKIATLLIDPDRLFREGLSKLLNRSRFKIASQASSVEEGLQQIEAGARFKLVLIGFGGTASEGLDLVEKARDLLPDSRIVVLTSDKSVHTLAEALRAGADGYLLKDVSPEAFNHSLNLVLAGEKVIPTHFTTIVASRIAASPDMARQRLGSKGLSEREIEILHCLVKGNPNKMIANRLNIKEGTVKTHLKGLLKKINATNRTQAAIWGAKHGLDGEPTKRRRS